MLAKQNESSQAVVVVSGDSQSIAVRNTLLSATSLEKYCNALRSFSNSEFSSAKWFVTSPEYHVPKELSFSTFSNISEALTVLVKCWAINFFSLAYSLGTIKSKIAKIAVFLKYFDKLNVPLTSIRNSAVQVFLSQYSETPELYNSMSCSISDFCNFASQNDIEFSEPINPPLLPVKHKTLVRRAPDQCVIDALDRFFFTKDDIPTDMKCAYLLLRLILNRISEILNMHIDCISYPEEGLFSILIPTKKETPLHRPFISKYSRNLSGEYTAVLYFAIQKQREYALMHQSDIPEEYSNYLFVSSQSPTRLLSNADFNTYLQKVCEDNKIMDSSGEIAHVTSHHLRHIGVTERLQSEIISPERIQKEANHLSMATTMGYGYSSVNDESQHTSNIVKNVFQDAFTEGQLPVINALPAKKYTVLQSNPFTRLLPGLGLCSNAACIPRFELCLKCEHFSPNECYYDYFLECSAIVKSRLEKLYENPTKNAAAIQFNEKYLQLYSSFTGRMSEKSESA